MKTSASDTTATLKKVSVGPRKYKKRKLAYNQFTMWREQKNVALVTENAMIAYFSELPRNCNLLSKYYFLKSILQEEDNIDIGGYTQLRQLLKRKTTEYLANKSKSFTEEEISRFLMEAPNDTYLLMKVVTVFCLAGGCTAEELSNITIDNIEDLGSVLVVKVPCFETSSMRTFIVNADIISSCNSLDLYRKYAALRLSNPKNKSFFVIYKDGKCHKIPVGKKGFKQIPSHIATFLQLPDPHDYNYCSFRKFTPALVAIEKVLK